MKTQNTNFFQALGKEQLENLVKEVKETVATNVPHVNQKTAFGVVDLWNLERSRRTRMVRRHFA
jgi:protein-arginine kinase